MSKWHFDLHFKRGVGSSQACLATTTTKINKRQQTKKNNNINKSFEVSTRKLSVKESSASNSSENFTVVKSRKSRQMRKKARR